MKIAIDAAKFTPAEANELRKAMATFRSRGTIETLQEKMVGKMVARGYDPEFSQRCFDQIKGFGDYGFPESHAASFAHLVYVSSWIKHYHPDVFCAALLNSQPMGFYAPAQIVRDAREHGVDVLPPDVNFSDWDNTLEPSTPTLSVVRLGLRQIDGMRKDVAERIEKARSEPFESLEDLKTRARMDAGTMRRLAAADAFRSMGLDRRGALWEARALKDAPDLPLFMVADARDEGADASVDLPQMPICEHVVADYQTTRLSLKAHPMAFLRKSMTRQGYSANVQLKSMRHGQRVQLAGLVLIRQRPGTAKGVCFITLEDETGVANLVVWPKVMERFRKVIMTARVMDVRGVMQTDGNVIHVVAHELRDKSDVLARLADNPDEQMVVPLAHADEVRKPIPSRSGPPRTGPGMRGHPRDARIIPKSRDFH